MAITVPNTQPIYPNRPLTWHAKLTTQVCGRDPSNTTSSSPPVLLGRAGKAGCMIDSLQFISLVTPVSGGTGASSGGPAAPSEGPDADDPNIGLHGWGTVGYEKAVNFYGKIEGSNELVWIGIVGLPTDSPAKGIRFGYPILPDPQIGYRMSPGEELYVALAKQANSGNATSLGTVVSCRGGHYSLDGESFGP